MSDVFKQRSQTSHYRLRDIRPSSSQAGIPSSTKSLATGQFVLRPSSKTTVGESYESEIASSSQSAVRQSLSQSSIRLSSLNRSAISLVPPNCVKLKEYQATVR